jgi:cell division septum initiation protein DivIVA
MTDGPQAHHRDGYPGVGSPGAPPRATGGARAAISSSDLEQRIAALAAQVRTLAQRFTVIPPASPAPRAVDPHSRTGPPDTAGEASSPASTEPLGARNAIVAAAEAAAGEILASAEREAELIRASADAGANVGSRALHDTIARQGATLAGLAAETTRLAHSASILQAQVSALEADMHQTLAVVDALAKRES